MSAKELQPFLYKFLEDSYDGSQSKAAVDACDKIHEWIINGAPKKLTRQLSLAYFHMNKVAGLGYDYNRVQESEKKRCKIERKIDNAMIKAVPAICDLIDSLK